MGNKVVIFIGGVIVALLAAHLIQNSSPSGALIYSEREDSTAYAYTLNDWIRGFFGIQGVFFPTGSCMEIPTGLFNEIVFRSISVTEDVSTKGTERVSTVMFGFEEDTLGALEMAHGNVALGGGAEDSYINLIAIAPVRIPKMTRHSYIELSLFGKSGDLFYVTRGQVRTPIIFCDFTSQNGQAICNCEAGRTFDYGSMKVGGHIQEGFRLDR